MSFWATDRYLFKYGFLDLYWLYGVSENWLGYWTRTLSYRLIISIYPQLCIQTKLNFVMYTSLDNIHYFHFKTFTVVSKETTWHHPQVTAPQCHNCFTRLTYFLKSIRAWKLTKETLLVITNMINLTTLQMSTLKVSTIKYVFKETWLILQINHFAYQSEQNSGSLVHWL